MAVRLVKWTLDGSVLKMVRLVKWTLDGSVLKMVKPLENATGEIQAEFNLTEIFPDFNELPEIRQQIIAYGTKQKLSDKGANEVANLGGKVTNAKEVWKNLVEGKWTGERMNATGASENKKALSNIKEASKVLDFNGLMAKKLMGIAEWTAEDEANLLRFMEIKMAEMKK